MQIEEVVLFETYAPGIQLTTVRLMLVLECMLDVKSKQGNVTCAFLLTELPEGQNPFVHMPQGFT